MRVTRAGGWWRIVYVRDSAEVAPASDGRGGPRAHDVDGRRWVHADGLEATACPEGHTLGSGIEGRRCAVGPKERHGQTKYECPV